MTGAELLLKKLAEDRESHVVAVVSGSVEDFAEYRRLCGVIRGLDIAITHINDLAERMKKEDE